MAIAGDNANGEVLGKQVKLVATNATTVVLPNTGHWLMEERPKETMDALLRFLGAPPSASAPVRARAARR